MDRRQKGSKKESKQPQEGSPSKFTGMILRLIALGFDADLSAQVVSEMANAPIEQMIMHMLQTHGPQCLSKNSAALKKEQRRRFYIIPRQKERDKTLLANIIAANPQLVMEGAAGSAAASSSSAGEERASTFPVRRPSGHHQLSERAEHLVQGLAAGRSSTYQPQFPSHTSYPPQHLQQNAAEDLPAYGQHLQLLDDQHVASHHDGPFSQGGDYELYGLEGPESAVDDESYEIAARVLPSPPQYGESWNMVTSNPRALAFTEEELPPYPVPGVGSWMQEGTGPVRPRVVHLRDIASHASSSSDHAQPGVSVSMDMGRMMMSIDAIDAPQGYTWEEAQKHMLEKQQQQMKTQMHPSSQQHLYLTPPTSPTYHTKSMSMSAAAGMGLSRSAPAHEMPAFTVAHVQQHSLTQPSLAQHSVSHQRSSSMAVSKKAAIHPDLAAMDATASALTPPSSRPSSRRSSAMGGDEEGGIRRGLGLFSSRSSRERSGSVVIHEDRPSYFEQPNPEEVAQVPVTRDTLEKSVGFRYYMEQHLSQLERNRVERVRRRQDLEEEMDRQGIPDGLRAHLRTILMQKESEFLRLRRAVIDLSSFEKIRTIGRGAFGQVCLVKSKDNGALYAMKILRKEDVISRNQIAHVKAERDILAEADNEWVVKLYYSFQDLTNLYFVMDYIPGGDLMQLLMHQRVFPEAVAQFYIAELVMAIASVHAMGFIHRDIKPDNILIDYDGHIKLTDFGLCTGFRWTHDSAYYDNKGQAAGSSVGSRQCDCDLVCSCGDKDKDKAASEAPMSRRSKIQSMANSLVGTPNYIAPEVFLQRGYDNNCDWWSVGVILYEMLVGMPPFLANSPMRTKEKVINWRSTLKIPERCNMSAEARDLILRLCCDVPDRLGSKGGVAEIRAHPFFRGMSWNRGNQPPYVPNVVPESEMQASISATSDDFRQPSLSKHNTLSPGQDARMRRDIFGDFNFRRFWSGGRGATI